MMIALRGLGGLNGLGEYTPPPDVMATSLVSDLGQNTFGVPIPNVPADLARIDQYWAMMNALYQVNYPAVYPSSWPAEYAGNTAGGGNYSTNLNKWNAGPRIIPDFSTIRVIRLSEYPAYSLTLEEGNRKNEYDVAASLARAAARDAGDPNWATVLPEWSGAVPAGPGGPNITRTGDTVTSNGATASTTVAGSSTSQTPATPSVIDSIVNSVTGSELVSSASLASIPTWAWLAGGAAALYFFMGRGK